MFTTLLKEVNCEYTTKKRKSGKDGGVKQPYFEFGQPWAEECPFHFKSAQIYPIPPVPAAGGGYRPYDRITHAYHPGS
jgi:hypothetical protein